MDLKAAVDDAIPFVKAVRNYVFPHNIEQDMVYPLHDEEEDCIVFGNYNFYPVAGTRKTSSLRGVMEFPCIRWRMTEWYTIYNYPDSPDDSDEREIGQFNSLDDCFAEIGKLEYIKHIAIVRERLDYAKAEEVSDFEQNEQKQCPHQKNPAECNDCMIASDLAYDAAREKR